MNLKGYGIRNKETGQYLSKVNLFTDNEKIFLDTSKDHADWIKEQFDKENNYKVEVVKISYNEPFFKKGGR